MCFDQKKCITNFFACGAQYVKRNFRLRRAVLGGWFISNIFPRGVVTPHPSLVPVLGGWFRVYGYPQATPVASSSGEGFPWELALSWSDCKYDSETSRFWLKNIENPSS